METKSFFDLKNKTAIVTVGGNEKGKSCCLTLLTFGASIVVSNLKPEDA